MRRFLFCLMLILIFLLLNLFASSAQASWSIWVYEHESGQLLRVDNNGQVISAQNIPALADNLYPAELIPSPDGSKLAYTLPDNQQIQVIDLATGAVIANIGLSDIGIAHNQDDSLYLSDVAFSVDGNHLVYVEILGGFGWQIHVYDFQSQAIVQSLTFGDEASQHYVALHGGIHPIISHISGDRVTFIVDVDFPVRVHSYHWFHQANILSETVAAPGLIATSFPYNSEIITALYDYRFPAENEDFRYRWQQVNTLHAYTFESGRFPIFFDPALNFERIWFVQGGERLLAEAYVDEIVNVRVLLGRDGNEIRRYPAVGERAVGTPDGFVYATDIDNQTAVVTVDSRNTDNAGTTLWVQPGNWQIIWAGSNQPLTTLPERIQLAQSIQDPTGIVDRYATPTVAPPVPPFRQVGMPIQIYVPEEGYLNLRDNPTTTSNIITLLESGTRGVISGGPVEADGFIWWEVSMSGRIGWVVEELPDSLALIPPQLIASPTPAPEETESP